MDVEIYKGLMLAQTMVLTSLIRRLHAVEAVDKDDVAKELRRLSAELPDVTTTPKFEVMRAVYDNLAQFLDRDLPIGPEPDVASKPSWTPTVLKGGKDDPEE